MLSIQLREGEEDEHALVLEITDDNFDETVKSHSVLVVDCWAEWCAPCRMVAPVIEELAEDYQGKITFGKLNVDTNQSVATRYQIMSIPTILVFKNGQMVGQKVGAMPKKMLEDEITRLL
ncbi:MAG: thioredoxin [Dehalococcoidia bacterium]|nr:thioredoxin [Dehalococcoidia bacterium]